jgi:hypothetical protein
MPGVSFDREDMTQAKDIPHHLTVLIGKQGRRTFVRRPC